MPRRLYLQVVLTLTVGLLAMVAALGWRIGRSQAQLFVAVARERARATTEAHADDAAHFLAVQEYAGLEQRALDAARSPEVLTVRIFEPDGRMLVNVAKAAEGAPARLSYALPASPVPARQELLVREEPGRLVVWAPISAGSLLGWIETTHSLRAVELMQRSIWRQTLLLGAAWTAAGVLLLSLALRRPMGAIRELSLFARDLPRRKGERVPVRRSANEIGLLADALDQASVELAESERSQRQLEAQLRHAQKMEAVGHLAGGIAHDFNNILTGILGYASLLKEGVPAGSPNREPIDEIEQAARRAATLTRGLLAFSRKQQMELRPTDLNEVVRNLEKMLRRIIGEDVELRVELSARPLVANADPAQLEQILVNLAANAKDAMPDGGLLSLATRATSVEELEGSGERLPLEGRVALLTVSDTGAGMDEELQQKIFEPFFTTKEVGRGTGLGLSIAHGIVQQHGGAIRVYSRPGIGTTFKIFLPLVAGSAASAAAPEAAPAVGGDERILIVEDEAQVRRVVRSILAKAGYTVVEAGDGAEALELLERQAQPFQLLVSDVIMPRLNGSELRTAVSARFPALRVLFVSGYTPEVIRRRGLLAEGDELLMKPFTAAELLGRVRVVLDRR
jgi:signal transduction histidine kinase